MLTSRSICSCCGGDVPHEGIAEHRSTASNRKHTRCTRRATVELRRTIDTAGKAIPKDSGWFEYCEPCARAIEAYQGNVVERRS